MAVFDEIAHGLRQVMNPRNIEFDEHGLDIVDSIRDLSKDEAREVLGKLEAQDAFTADDLLNIRRVVLAIQGLAEGTAAQAGRVRLVAADLIADGGQGFRVPFLQSQFSSWAKKTLTADSTADVSPNAWLTYLKANQSNTKTMRILFVLLGAEWDAVAAATARAQRSDRWPMLRLIYRALTGSVNTAAGMKALVTGTDDVIEAAVRAKVEDSLRHLGNTLRPTPELGDDIVEGMVYFAENGDLAGPMTDRILNLLRRYSPDGTLQGLREEDLLRLVGQRGHSVDQVIDELAFGHILLYREMSKMARQGAANGMDLVDDEIDDLFRAFMNLEGAEQFFELTLRRAGYEHGLLFEQLLTFQVLHYLRANPHMLPNGLEVAECIILQSRIADKCGPDLLLIQRIDGKLVATIIQAKSYKQLNSLVRKIVTNSGVEAVSGAIVGQGKKDIRRLLREAGENQTSQGVGNLGLDVYDNVLHSKIDWNRLQREQLDLDLDAVRDYLPPGASIDGMSLDQVITSADPDISRAARAAFYDQHLADVVTSVNEEMVRFGDVLAAEVSTMTVDAFRAAYGRPQSGGAARTAYEETLLALASTTPNPGARATAFKKYYNAMFNNLDANGETLVDGVTMHFQLVDTRLDPGDLLF